MWICGSMNSDTTSRTQPRNVHSSNKFMLERVEPPAYGPPPPPPPELLFKSFYPKCKDKYDYKNLNNRFKR